MSQSTAELLLATQLEQAGIPFEREYQFDPDRKWRADFLVSGPLKMYAWQPDLIVEIEGGIGGSSRHLTYTGFTNDCEKYAAAAILGYRVIRATTEQVDNGTCLAWIEAALGLEREKRVAS